MKRPTRRDGRLWATLAATTCVVVLLALAVLQSAWAEGECSWEKVIYIDDQGPFPSSSGAGLAVGNDLTIVDTLWCDFAYGWLLDERWPEPPLSLVDSEYQVPATVTVDITDTLPGELQWSGGYPPDPVPAGEAVVLTKTLHVDSPGWATKAITQEVNFSFEGEITATQTLELELWEMVEGGDAPSSHNHQGRRMTAYRPGGPPGVQANVPVVWDWDGTLGPGPSSDYGFCHWSSESPSFLGSFFTWERDADLLPDHDGLTNIEPPGDAPDRDSTLTPSGADDGMQFPTVLPSCGTATVPIQGSNNSGGTLYLNVWADWNRDGDWQDVSLCTCGVDEWAVKDYAVTASGAFSVNAPITPCHPGGDPTAPLWVRVTLAEDALVPLGTPWSWGGQPYPAFDPAGGSQGCFEEGETEDYIVEPVSPECVWDKQVFVNGEYAGEWDEGPFIAGLNDEITIEQGLSCNFDYGWDLWEYWGSSALYLKGHQELAGTVSAGSSYLHWQGGSPTRIAAGTWVTMTNTLGTKEPGWTSTYINETVEFDPMGPLPSRELPVLEESPSAWMPLAFKRF
jgi:hypothetical protein